MRDNIKAKYMFNLKQVAEKYDTYSIHLDYDGNPIILVSMREKNNNIHTIFHFTSSGKKKINIPPIQEDFHLAQPFEDNWMLVNARVRDNRTHNAFIYTDLQEMLTSFHMGDGIEDVQVTQTGEIWASYFDEGVFGESIGTSGLLCFDRQGNKIFDFEKFIEESKNKMIPYIADCYALNVCSDETVYLYYYTDFPLLAVHNKTDFELFQEEVLSKSPIGGSHAFAVWDSTVLFAHGYKQKGLLYLYSKNNQEILTLQPVNEKNEKINYDYAVARANIMLLVSKDNVYLVDIQKMI